jgi:DNA polymerase-3 subunit delta'
MARAQPQEDAPQREYDEIPGVTPPEQTRVMFGHTAARDTVLDAHEEGKLHHGWLVHGPRGIGKATLAFDLARALLARSSDQPAEMVSEQIAQGAHPNVTLLRRRPNPKTGRFGTQITVDDVRRVNSFFQHSSARAGLRIAIVDALDDLNRNAANALLKTLEEPPASGLFILIAHRPGTVLPTIRSRTRSLSLQPLSPYDTERAVTAQTDAEDASDLEHALSLAHGRPRKAFEVLRLADSAALDALETWLSHSERHSGTDHLEITAALTAKRDSGGFHLALERIADWLAAETRHAALTRAGGSWRLESLLALWDKAQALAQEQQIYNLDRQQTLLTILDDVRTLPRAE